MKNSKLILAGDVGGTKTELALFTADQVHNASPLISARFASGDHGSLEAVVAEFLQQTGMQPQIACFGVAGPVDDQRARVTNLPWVIDVESIRQRFALPQVLLLNDLQATATAVPFLREQDLGSLSPGHVVPQGPIAVIAPGTGLGVAFLLWSGSRYQAFASEGGHCSFAPRSPIEVELLRFLQGRYGHVSFERICSGRFLPNIFDFFVERGAHDVPPDLLHRLEQAPDRTPVIVQSALEQRVAICTATLDLFVQALATIVGNMALTLLPTGGVYLGGGMPRLLTRLRQPDFLRAITDKGRFAPLLGQIPVHVILAPQTALHGAARHAMAHMEDASNSV